MTEFTIPSDIQKIIIELRNSIIQYPWVSNVYLFGSYANNTYNSDSDIDIAVFVFEQYDCGIDKFKAVNALARDKDIDIQIQVFSRSELNDPCGIVEEVVQHGFDITKEGRMEHARIKNQ